MIENVLKEALALDCGAVGGGRGGYFFQVTPLIRRARSKVRVSLETDDADLIVHGRREVNGVRCGSPNNVCSCITNGSDNVGSPFTDGSYDIAEALTDVAKEPLPLNGGAVPTKTLPLDGGAVSSQSEIFLSCVLASYFFLLIWTFHTLRRVDLEDAPAPPEAPTNGSKVVPEIVSNTLNYSL